MYIYVRHFCLYSPQDAIAHLDPPLIAAASAFPTLPEEFGLTSSAEGAADAATIVAAVAAAVAVAVTAPVTCVRAVWCVVAQCNVMVWRGVVCAAQGLRRRDFISSSNVLTMCTQNHTRSGVG